ncbi:hypothetical protein E2C01_051214 [Portunus trituberculatus]|uniref:Uncharacterized protein n=1 Tax=Portunus trituberculatus TaxID=210409 RepID=A0A5B7GIZ2_PORTR|nr:hypothetical protein [Portunus trituberculatus]
MDLWPFISRWPSLPETHSGRPSPLPCGLCAGGRKGQGSLRNADAAPDRCRGASPLSHPPSGPVGHTAARDLCYGPTRPTLLKPRITLLSALPAPAPASPCLTLLHPASPQHPPTRPPLTASPKRYILTLGLKPATRHGQP